MSETKADHLDARGYPNVIQLDDYRPVWLVARERCAECDNAGISVVHMNADLDHLQCTFCGQMAASVTHIQVGEQEDEPLWEARAVEDLSGSVQPLHH